MIASLWLGATGCAHERPLETSSNETRANAGIASEPLCVLAGPSADRPGVYGTDLGYSVPSNAQGQDPLLVLFGDTWGEAGDACKFTGGESDDLIAELPAELPADVASATAGASARTCGDLLHYQLDDTDDVRTWPRMLLYPVESAVGRAEDALPMSTLRTPVAAFRDASAIYAVVHRNDPARCSVEDECPSGMQCSAQVDDVALGLCERAPGTPDGSARTLCRDDSDCTLAACERIDMCVSRKPFELTTSDGDAAPNWYQRDARRSAALTMYIARLVDAEESAFVIAHRFETNRFTNVAVRTVAHFDPDRPQDNDYRPGNDALLMWGRPMFVGTGGAQSLPFLLYQKLPAEPDRRQCA